ncbi:hypothetical protein A6A06_25715 [Streptomyces sp. CB02923]|uniref:hypothetical protein n=1 Tax=Streptomyces sp. CB02923 TaxID=1718985 RepID=UPI0009403364|nr:hypothetical protein [Streptomyces sp. CB02923]OKH99000.1 hypothetical protein A6A06_25715 [Streptomyces sp. CB02923]
MTESTESGAVATLHGTVHPDAYFRFEERKALDWNLWSDVLRGDITGAIFRGVLSAPVCERICRNFWSSPVLKRRADGLPSHGRGFVGASIVSLDLDTYLDESERIRADVGALFDGTEDALASLLDDYGDHLAARGCRLRLAEHRGRRAQMFKMRSWRNTGPFVLVPHDDASVMRSPHLAGFEAGEVARVVGVAACVENGAGGELHYWNITPDRDSRDSLGFRYDSVGYPLESLRDFRKLTVPVQVGDVYVFDSSKVHAVGRKLDDTDNRSTVLWSMGFLDANTVLHWA